MDFIFEFAVLACLGLTVAGIAGMFWSLYFTGPGWTGLLFLGVTVAGGLMAGLLHDAQEAVHQRGLAQERQQQ